MAMASKTFVSRATLTSDLLFRRILVLYGSFSVALVFVEDELSLSDSRQSTWFLAGGTDTTMMLPWVGGKGRRSLRSNM